MPAFFKHARGAVKQVKGPWQGAPQFRLRVDRLRQNIQSTKAIITQVAVNQQGNYQFLHTINSQIFVYVFGDRISELQVSGVAFGNPCTGGTGFDNVLRGYGENKISISASPAVVVIGNFRFQSFLTGSSLDIVDAETQLGQFSYRFHSFPDSQ